MAKLVTINLRFPAEMHRELRYHAARRRVPVALIVREAVDRYLGRTDQKASPIPLGSDPADQFIGCVSSGVGDESVNHDHYLYGWPKEDDGQSSVRGGRFRPGRRRRRQSDRPGR